MMNMNVATYLGVSMALAIALGCGGITQPLGDVGGASSNGDAAKGGASSTGNGQAGSKASSAPGGSAAVHPCETECLEKVRANGPATCELCHTSRTSIEGGLQSSGLDLESPNVTARLKDVPSKHLDLPASLSSGCPSGDFLVDSADPENSWLLKKVKGQQGACGDPMPQTGTLSLAALDCIETYVYCVAGQARP